MTDPMHIFKVDPISSLIALTAIPAPIVVPTLDDAAKIAAFVYSVLGAIYLLRQIFKSK